MADQQRDVIEILTHDHREVEQMFSELESLAGGDDEGAGGSASSRCRLRFRARNADAGIHEHVAKEKGQVFPNMRTVFSADELVDLRPQQCTAGGLGLPSGGHQSGATSLGPQPAGPYPGR